MEDPRLPLDIEGLIFEFALRDWTGNLADLFLVAHRVQEWLIPKAFRVIVIHKLHHFPTRFTSELFKRYGKFVRHLSIAEQHLDGESSEQYDGGIVQYCLSCCTNLVSLALWWGGLHAPIEVGVLSRSPMTRISIDLVPLFKQLTQQQEPLFPNITHLEVLNEGDPIFRSSDERQTLTHHFPNITHIGIYRWEHLNYDEVRFFLQNYPRLRVLVLWECGDMGLDEAGGGLVKEVLKRDEEYRRVVVVMRCERVDDWVRGARGIGHDMWSFAEMVLEERGDGGGGEEYELPE